MQQNSDNKNNYNVFKYKLLTPGPVPMPPIALKALAQEALHHRTPKFEEILASSLSKLKLLFKTQQDVLIHTATGSGALESAVVNTLNSNEKVICIVSGKFGERWQKICETYNIPIIKYNVEWGQCADPKQLDELLQQNPGVQAVLTQHCETSTATLHPLKELARVCKKHQSLILVDAITSLGATEFLFDDWNIDVAVAGSQKAFMMPAGLSFICLSPLAWKRTKTSNLPKFYFNLSQESAAQMKASTYFSSAVSHITCLNETLSYLIDENLNQTMNWSKELQRTTQSFAKTFQLSTFSSAPSPSVSALTVPLEIDGEVLRHHIEKKYGTTVMGGQDQLKGKILRIGHLGYLPANYFCEGLINIAQGLRDLVHEDNKSISMQNKMRNSSGCFDAVLTEEKFDKFYSAETQRLAKLQPSYYSDSF